MPDEIKKIAAYARVSTEDQATEGFSLSAQTETSRAYAELQDWTIYDEYIDDGYSGRNTKRPEYTRMMSDIDKWDAILVVKMDRIHRNSRNFMAMMDILDKKGKKFVSSTDSLDTSTASGSFFVDMIQRIAQLESELIGERTK
jgi:DNA invertase Pin-like site-specific DNA recombinase